MEDQDLGEGRKSTVASDVVETETNPTLDAAPPVPEGGWRCFHCDEVFTDRELAAEHFGDGDYEAEIPLCIEAATTEQRQLIATNREMWEQLQKAQSENEELEFRLHDFEYITRKLTKKPSATINDLENEWDFMQGRVIAAEAQAASAVSGDNNPSLEMSGVLTR